MSVQATLNHTFLPQHPSYASKRATTSHISMHVHGGPNTACMRTPCQHTTPAQSTTSMKLCVMCSMQDPPLRQRSLSSAGKEVCLVL
jgi:hypothetical protein